MPEKGTLSSDIPRAPHLTYKGLDWTSWGDWLGTGTIATFDREYRPFEEAREFVRSLGLSSSPEWRKYLKGELPEKGTLPDDIPANPNRTYKDQGWDGFGDWLGTGRPPYRRDWRPFEEAREFVRSLGLTGQSDWRKYCRGDLPEKGTLPDDIPYKPNVVYKDEGWLGIRDWLGTGRKRRS